MFSMSHRFKSNSFSSKRTSYCAKELDIEMKSIFFQYTNLQIFLYTRKYNFLSLEPHVDIICRKFNFAKDFPKFFLLPNLSLIGSFTDLSIKNLHPKKSVLFSGKESNDNEPLYLKQNLNERNVLINIKKSSFMRVIDTLHGGSYYHGSQFMFLLIPRHHAIEYGNNTSLINALTLIQSKKPRLHSNRGKNHSVYFEGNSSNYVDLGVGACRSMPGLYLRSCKGVSEQDIKAVEDYFHFVNVISKQFLPKSLLKKFNDILNEIELDNFKALNSYSKKNCCQIVI